MGQDTHSTAGPDCDACHSGPPPAPPPPPSPPPPAPPSPGGTILARVSNRCLDLPGGDTSNGNQLWVWDCSGGNTQHWVFQNWAIRYGGNTNKCVDISGGKIGSGTVLQLWDCNGQDSQKWGYDGNLGTIYAGSSLADASQCMDAHDGGRGANIMIWQCNGLQNQQWALNSEHCLDPLLDGREVNYTEMSRSLRKQGLSDMQLKCHWANIHNGSNCHWGGVDAGNGVVVA